MRHIVTSMGPATGHVRLAQLYEELPPSDFSRDILQRSPDLLRVLTVPACGWSDLGTPRRVVETVNRFRGETDAARQPRATTFFDLAGVMEARV
jgi:mannose-1-phosphate guanylyltransferase